DTAAAERAGTSFIEDHQSPCIDYMTFHLWVENWGWFDPKQPHSYVHGLRYAKHYIGRHAAMAALLGKPAVLEEFGIARDGGSHQRSARTGLRAAYFSAVMQSVYKNVSRGGPLAGLNFWAWGGEALPPEAETSKTSVVPATVVTGPTPAGASHTTTDLRKPPAPSQPGVPPRHTHHWPLSGDPPHEWPGWYSVYANDKETLRIIQTYARLLDRGV
ncbi:MAG: hypothetical protein ACPGUV_10735, partial [Polyangiales bacterium]